MSILNLVFNPSPPNFSLYQLWWEYILSEDIRKELGLEDILTKFEGKKNQKQREWMLIAITK